MLVSAWGFVRLGIDEDITGVEVDVVPLVAPVELCWLGMTSCVGGVDGVAGAVTWPSGVT